MRTKLSPNRAYFTMSVSRDQVLVTWCKGWFDLTLAEQDEQIKRAHAFVEDTVDQDRDAFHAAPRAGSESQKP